MMQENHLIESINSNRIYQGAGICRITKIAGILNLNKMKKMQLMR